MKRFLSLLVSCALVISLVPSAFAASSEAVNAANALYERGLFNGTGTDANGDPVFDLDRAPTRHEAATMLVRLLGKAGEAENGTWNIPFTDVADWAKPYIGYAYANGLTAGVSEAAYGGEQNVTASQYLTFVLRALGYESGTDFQWDRAWELSDQIGLTNGQYSSGTAGFTRGDVAIISNQALNTTLKGSSTTLAQTLDLNVQADHKSDADTKSQILGIIISGLETTKAATDQALAEIDSVSGSNHSNAYLSSYYVEVLQREQQQYRTVIGYWDQAIDMCGTYSDTQAVKQYLGELVDLYEEYCNYNITTANITDFTDYMESFTTRQDEILDKIDQEVDRWVEEGT